MHKTALDIQDCQLLLAHRPAMSQSLPIVHSQSFRRVAPAYFFLAPNNQHSISQTCAPCWSISQTHPRAAFGSTHSAVPRPTEGATADSRWLLRARKILQQSCILQTAMEAADLVHKATRANHAIRPKLEQGGSCSLQVSNTHLFSASLVVAVALQRFLTVCLPQESIFLAATALCWCCRPCRDTQLVEPTPRACSVCQEGSEARSGAMKRYVGARDCETPNDWVLHLVGACSLPPAPTQPGAGCVFAESPGSGTARLLETGHTQESKEKEKGTPQKRELLGVPDGLQCVVHPRKARASTTACSDCSGCERPSRGHAEQQPPQKLDVQVQDT